MIEFSSSSILALQAGLPVKAAAAGVSIPVVEDAKTATQNTSNATNTLSVGPPANALSTQALLAVQQSEESAKQDPKRQKGAETEDTQALPIDEKGNAQGLTREEQAQVSQLQQIDADVRRHEQAHASTGGGAAGAPNYEYTKGPDGKQYATGGEVSISVPTGGGDPESRLDKLRQVQQAALAPSNPSAQDLRVAASAAQGIIQAQTEIRQEQNAEPTSDESNSVTLEPRDSSEIDPNRSISDTTSAQAAQAFQAAANLTISRSNASSRSSSDGASIVI